MPLSAFVSVVSYPPAKIRIIYLKNGAPRVFLSCRRCRCVRRVRRRCRLRVVWHAVSLPAGGFLLPCVMLHSARQEAAFRFVSRGVRTAYGPYAAAACGLSCVSKAGGSCYGFVSARLRRVEVAVACHWLKSDALMYPRATALTIRSAMLRAPSLAKRRLRCVSTVFSDM